MRSVLFVGASCSELWSSGSAVCLPVKARKTSSRSGGVQAERGDLDLGGVQPRQEVSQRRHAAVMRDGHCGGISLTRGASEMTHRDLDGSRIIEHEPDVAAADSALQLRSLPFGGRPPKPLRHLEP